MNNNILKKCVLELSQDNPKLDYIRGMLETLIEIQGVRPEFVLTNDAELVKNQPFSHLKEKAELPKAEMLNSGFTRDVNGLRVDENNLAIPKDEGSILDAKAAAALAQVKKLAAKSVEIS